MKPEVVEQIRIAYQDLGIDLSEYSDKDIEVHVADLVKQYKRALWDKRYRFVPVKASA